MLQPLPMQNKKFHVVLLAGGPRDIARELRDKLAKTRNVFIKYHYEYDKEHQWDRPIPKDVDFVIMLKDMMSHSLFYKMKKSCESEGLRWVLTQRKMATMLMALNNYGIKKSAGVPADLRSVAYFDDSDPEIASNTMAKNVKETVVPVQEQKPADVNIFVSQVPVPEFAPTSPRMGCPRPETMVLIAALQKLAQDDRISIMITPCSITVEPA